MSTTLIPPREVFKILTWVTSSALYSGAGGTDVLTRYHVGKRQTLYSREECEALKESIIATGTPHGKIIQKTKQQNIIQKIEQQKTIKSLE